MLDQDLEQKRKDYDVIVRAMTLCRHNGAAVRQLGKLQCRLRDEIREREYDPFRVATREVSSRLDYALNNVVTATRTVEELLTKVRERKRR